MMYLYQPIFFYSVKKFVIESKCEYRKKKDGKWGCNPVEIMGYLEGNDFHLKAPQSKVLGEKIIDLIIGLVTDGQFCANCSSENFTYFGPFILHNSPVR